MEYRGLEYSVVRTITNKWRWSVKRDRNDRVGTAATRAAAIGSKVDRPANQVSFSAEQNRD